MIAGNKFFGAWAFLSLAYGLAPDTTSFICLQSPCFRRGRGFWSSTAETHTAGSPDPLVVPSLSTLSWLVTFVMRSGTLGLSRTSILAISTPYRELFWLDSMRTLAAPRGASTLSSPASDIEPESLRRRPVRAGRFWMDAKSP